jgi:2-desacetyl-2-hydroxyethyl bacteriochlorophyllide A dehydrogenase
MDVVVCERPGVLSIIERPEPPRKSGEILIRIRRVGMCGTDYHIFSGTQPYLSYPRVMGHELSGEVVEADSGSPFLAGQTVCVMPYFSCGRCGACIRGKENCCRNLQVLGVHCDGGLAEFLSIPERFVIDADGLSFDEAAMVEFLSIGHHAVKRAEALDVEEALVVGAGPIGMAVTLFAARRGARVTVTDFQQFRLDFCARELGAAEIIPVDASATAPIAELTKDEGFHTVFDATGNPRAMEAGFSYVAHGGTYVLVSIVAGDISFSDPEFHKRETTLLASRNATIEDFRAVIAAIRKGEVPTHKLHTHTGHFSELPAAIKNWAAPDTGVIKAIVELN